MKKILFVFALIVVTAIIAVSQEKSSFSEAYLDYLQNPYNYAMPPVANPLPFEVEDTKEALPASYSMVEAGYYTPVRNQEPHNMCWAFTGAAIAETAACVKYDCQYSSLSPLNILNKNPLYPYFLSLDSGGNKDHFTLYFYKNRGPVYEKDDPYVSPWESPTPQPAKPGVVENVYNLSDDEAGISSIELKAIKEHVYTTGGVSLGIYWDEKYMSGTDLAYYTPIYKMPNHFVTVVGWDDNCSKYQFKNQPPFNGAFLCKNSYGPERHEGGYFWLSYYDKNAVQAVGVDYSANSDVEYNKFYNYCDGVGTATVKGYKYGKAVFEADTGGYVRGVRTYVPIATVLQATVTNSKGESVTKMYPAKYTGYVSIIFDEPLAYRINDTLTMIIDYNGANKSGNDLVPCESEAYDHSITYKEGRTFCSKNGTGWADMAHYKTNLAAGILTTEVVPVSTIKPDRAVFNLLEGEEDSVNITYTPSNATYPSFVWTTSDSKVATVTPNNGAGTKAKIKAIGEGEATLTVMYAKDKTTKAYVTVRVAKNDVRVTGVSLDYTSLRMKKGANKVLIPTVKPSNATNKEVTWTSSNKDVAYVNSSGKVSAYTPGEAVITCKTKDGGYKATCKVVVYIPVTGVSLSPGFATLIPGETKTFKAKVKPSDATDTSVRWSSTDTSVAKVSSSGKVTAVGEGTATITVTTNDGNYKALSVVGVSGSVRVTGVTLDKTSLKLKKGAAKTLIPIVMPSNATNKEVTWSSSDTSVAGVGSNGKVSAYAPGTATITCKTKDGGFKATCEVTVYIPVTGITLDLTSLDLYIADEIKLKPTVKPSNATDKTITWTTSNASVAKVNNGKITGKGKGTATITATTNDGGFTATCSVTVKSGVKVTGVTLDKTTLTLNKGQAKILTPTITPSNAANKEVYWSSSNKTVAGVGSNGKVSAYAPGTATITCTTRNGGFKATCKVTVK